MFDKNKCLERLRSMSLEDVASMVKKALEDAGVELYPGPTKIIFDGLLDDEDSTKE